ncbi:hypothetical protein [Streptomyces sp. NPDC093261]|uniref:hypothetical protein n=1 Tax=Streptomyces sp. NPDC093261 TaxID=3366037 RepID=UPI0037F4D7FE
MSMTLMVYERRADGSERVLVPLHEVVPVSARAPLTFDRGYPPCRCFRCRGKQKEQAQ